MALRVVPCLSERGALGNLVRRQTGGRFHPAAEVEEGGQSRDLPDRLVAPAALLQSRGILLADEARRLGQLAGVTKQCPGLRLQLVLGPGRRELIVEMLIAGEAANCRRMEPQSRGSAHLAIDHGGQHLALEPAEG